MVIDTNVLLDLWLFRNPGVGWLASALGQGRLHWLATAAMLDELAQVRARDFAARHCALPELYQPPAHRVATPPAPAPLRCRDPSDQKFLDLACHWRCALLSRDRHLLSLQRRARRFGLLILRPEEAGEHLPPGRAGTAQA